MREELRALLVRLDLSDPRDLQESLDLMGFVEYLALL